MLDTAVADACHLSYAVWWSQADQLYLATAVGMQGATIHGETPQEALGQAIELAGEWIAEGYPPALTPLMTGRDTTARETPRWNSTAVADVRLNLGLSQAVFADLLNVSRETVRAWE